MVNSRGLRIAGVDKWRVMTETPKSTNFDWKTRRRAVKNIECGIAALVSSEPSQETTLEDISQVPPKEPCIYSTLPLPIESNLPVYLHATFALDGDRKALHLEGHGQQLDERLNTALFEVHLSKLYLHFLEDLGANANEDALRFWPHDSPQKGSCSVGLFAAFWKQVPKSSQRLFPKVSLARNSRIVTVEHSTFNDAVFNFYENHKTKHLEPLLVGLGLNLIQPLPSKITGRLQNMSNANGLTQAMLRELFSANENKAHLEKAIELDSCVLDTLLEFALEIYDNPAQLNGCYFLQLADGNLGTIKLHQGTGEIDYYEATTEEIALFPFASSILISSTKFRTIKRALDGTASNVARLQPVHVQKLLSMRQSDSISTPWLTKFWVYWKRSTNTSEAMLEDLPVYLAHTKQGIEYVKGSELRAQPAVVSPNQDDHQKLCKKFPGLWQFDSAFMPTSLASQESSFSEPASFFRFIRALKILCPGIEFGRFVKTYLDNDDMEVLYSTPQVL